MRLSVKVWDLYRVNCKLDEETDDAEILFMIFSASFFALHGCETWSLTLRE
jgi:hypothetical protein